MSKPIVVTVNLRQTHGVDFGFHIEGDKIVIDECEGLTVEEGLSLFDEWLYDALYGTVSD